MSEIEARIKLIKDQLKIVGQQLLDAEMAEFLAKERKIKFQKKKDELISELDDKLMELNN